MSIKRAVCAFGFTASFLPSLPQKDAYVRHDNMREFGWGIHAQTLVLPLFSPKDRVVAIARKWLCKPAIAASPHTGRDQRPWRNVRTCRPFIFQE
jgi:hypothetical protein